MRRAVLLSAALIAVCATPARAQDVTLASVAGTWHTRVMVGPKDSIVLTNTTVASADKDKWITKNPGQANPVALRVVAVGGDSIATEAGPYPSVLRPGQTVTMLRSVMHYKGNKATGWFEAHYSSGDVVKGKLEGTRSK
jgi:hypothetical protein